MTLTPSLWLRFSQRAATAAMSLGSGWSEVWRGRRGRSFLWLSSPLSPSSVCWYWWEYSSTGGTNTHTHTHTGSISARINVACVPHRILMCLRHRNCFQAANFYPDDTASPKVISAPSTPMLLATGNTHAEGFYYKEFGAAILNAH